MIKTSTTHPLRMDELELAGGGTIGLTLCPGKKQPSAMTGAWDRDLATDLCEIARWGATAVVTLMEPGELDRLQVSHLGDAVEERGMDWYQLAIPDGGIPDASFEAAWLYAGYRLHRILAQGKKVLIHCMGGLGRTGMIAARLLIELGSSPEEAITRVRQARPGSIETRSQEHYVRNWATSRAPEGFSRILGCIIGGAIGDGFGYEIEFSDLAAIRAHFGAGGIREPQFHEERLIVSDDTQMTLFTAEGLSRGMKAASTIEVIVAEIRAAYLDWLLTQGLSWQDWRPKGRLSKFPVLRHRRAPGNTCLSALRAGGNGSIANPVNHSKGCGGAMRTAPIGLITAWSVETCFDVGARASAITHGHPSGYWSGGAMAAIVRGLSGGASLEDAAETAAVISAASSRGEETAAAIRKALDLARGNRRAHEDAIRELGAGWVGEEALAIGLYAALVGGSFAETLAIAANHSGDSDSTASIAGQIYGTQRGVEEMPNDWVRRLDVIEPIYAVIPELSSAIA